MKFKLIIALTFLISGLLVLGYFKAVPGAQGTNNPQIEILPQDFNFGDIRYGQVVEYAFVVKNSGKTDLEIGKVATSCSCTTAKVEQKIIKPGETALLSVKYNSGAMGEMHGKGEQERIIYVRSNDPVNPQAQVTIHANIIQ